MFENLWRSSRANPPTSDEIRRTTEEAHLAHQAKIQALSDLVMVDDLEQLAFDDREKVRQYEAATVKGRQPTREQGIHRRKQPGKGKGMVDDLGHILGDVTIEQPANKNPLSSLIVPLATLGLLGLIAWKMLDQPDANLGNPTDDKDYQAELAPGFGEPVYVDQ